MQRRAKSRCKGAALVLVLILGIALLALSTVSVTMTLVRNRSLEDETTDLVAHQVAESGLADALAKIRELGIIEPHSGSGSSPAWVDFGNGSYYYSTVFDTSAEVSTIRVWGRVKTGKNAVASPDSPDSITFDSTGWAVPGFEVAVRSSVFVPESPLYFGNGGIERPLGGFEWTSGADPADSSTWGVVTSNPSSSQDSTVPFQVSALDHPADFLSSGAPPSPASTYPHPYKIWASQNPIGQFNIEAWFSRSAGAADPSTAVDPPPTSTYYETSDRLSPHHPYPVDSKIPDVQDFAWALWNEYAGSSRATQLVQGSHSGTFGTLANPSVTFVTGQLTVNSGKRFEGTGILVIRDDYDPNVDKDNTPGKRAGLHINGDFRWTGLVIVAGWAPTVTVTPGADATIVGSFFGEDSVQSGGEVSLDSTTVALRIKGGFRVYYSNTLFARGGLLHDYLPGVKKQIIGIREIKGAGSKMISSTVAK